MAVLSTYSATAATPASTETSTVTTETSATTVDNNGALTTEQGAATPTAEATNVETTNAETTPTETDDSVVDFSLGGETTSTPDTTTQQTASTTTQPQQPVFDLDEQLKKVDRKEILKKLGVSEFAIEMDTHIASGGQPVDYLNARAINYDLISDEELVKQDLKKSYPNFSAEEINRMYNRKYGTNDSMSEDEIQDVNLELKARGYALKQALKTEQQKFKIAEVAHSPQTNEAYEQWKQSQEENTNLIKQLNEFYNGHTATKSLNESKSVTINFGEGVKPLNFKIDKPELITNAMLDGGLTIAQRSLNEKGEPDVQRQQLGTFLALDPYKTVQLIFNYGKSIGERSKRQMPEVHQ
jgi:hypothetical protein